MKASLRQHKLLLMITLFFSIITAAAGVLIALVLQKVIDAALQGDRGLFREILVISVVYLLLLGVMGLIYNLCSKALIRNLTLSLRERVFRGIFSRKAEAFAASNTADYLSALTNDIKQLEDQYIQPLLQVMQNVVVFAASVLVLLYISPLVTAILAGCMVLIFIIPSLFGTALQTKQSAVSAQMSIFTIRLKDLLSGFEVIKSYAMGTYAGHKFQTENRQAADTRFAADRLFALNESVSQTLAILTQFAVVFVAAYLIITGNLSAGSLVALVQLSGGFVGPVLVIMENLPKIKGVRPVVERIDALSAQHHDTPAEQLDPQFNVALSANHLQFGYTPGQPVLKDVSLTLDKGKKYALAGPSGCGKSTLVKLLTGYYDRYEGTVELDGTNLKQLDTSRLQELVSTIHQNVYMFDSDIHFNICLHEEFSAEQLEEVLHTSGIHKFLEQTNGLQSPVGENGSQLSGGQRQRIAVARALIRNKPILILDEGTSAIDMQTAYEIEGRLLALEDLTLITITHNMNELMLGRYDEIIYMEEGRIAERGSLHELLAYGGRFHDFYTQKEAVTPSNEQQQPLLQEIDAV
ncbi:ABC transporter ATP-binding protein [Paenibacillus donghaensis]|uniref:ABC transporter permease n=1 Tax=Paenibacillus donghaensis TaxID=414771 RepID=A0A2Z2K8A6_9BACL|nr:ABC transporter ATP-binding protein [Paenibacillus donghaensis]ASA21447.1 ABC transporter permease [Paenibacillus donghaensis]